MGNKIKRFLRFVVGFYTGRECKKCKFYDNGICDSYVRANMCIEHIYPTEFKKRGKKKMTNYDRIKSMSVEEMAQELTEVETVGYECMIPNGYNGWKEYLLQEVSENE